MAGFSCEFNLFIICLQIRKEWKIINVLIEYSKVIILKFKKKTYKKWGEQAPRISLWHRISDSSVIKVISKKSSSFRNSLNALDKFEEYSFHRRQYLLLSIVDIFEFLRKTLGQYLKGKSSKHSSNQNEFFSFGLASIVVNISRFCNFSIGSVGSA